MQKQVSYRINEGMF